MMPPAETYYSEIAPKYEAWHSTYDLERRLEILFDPELNGILVLDAGTGPGHFAARAAEAGARVVAVDIAFEMLKIARTRSGARMVCGDLGRLPFRSGAFDKVISSEAIEHTVDPIRAVHELVRVLTMNGTLALSTPNRLWYPSLMAARLFGLRKFEGLENWLSWRRLRKAVVDAGAIVERRAGVHLFPFQWKALQPLLRRLDSFGRRIGFLYINQVIWARKV